MGRIFGGMQLLYADKTFLASVLVSGSFLFGAFFLILERLAPLGQSNAVVALHYNIFFGVDALGNWRAALFLPFFAVAVLFVNSALAVLLYQRERFVSYALLFVAVFGSVLTCAAALFVVLVNL